MNKDKAKEFYKQAQQYLCFIVENVVTFESIPSLIEILMALYISAMNLPDAEIEAEKEGEIDADTETIDSSSDISETDHFRFRKQIRFSEQIPTTYWEVFNPYIDEDSICGDLVDDLSDIAWDLRVGMREYEAGRIEDAIFEWKFRLTIHYGHHIVDALRALHAVRTEYTIDRLSE